MSLIIDSQKHELGYMKDMELDEGYRYEVDTIAKERWNELLDNFQDATIYQTWSYGEVRWGVENISHIVLKHEGEIKSAAQVRIFNIPILGLAIAYVYRGPLWRRKNSDDNSLNLQQIIRALYHEYAVSRKHFLRIVPNEVSDSYNQLSLLFNDEGFKHSTSAHPYNTIQIELSPSIDKLHQGFSKKWRENLRRSKRSGLNLLESTNIDLYDIFIDLYKQMHARKKFVEFVDIQEFRRIQEDLPQNLKLNILVCENENKPVSALVYTSIGNTAITLFSATGNHGRKLRGSYLLRWEMLKKIKESNFKYFDQGGINKKENPGGYHFKSGMGGTEAVYMGEFERCESATKYMLIKLAERLLNMRKKLQVMLNKFFINLRFKVHQ